MISWQRMQERHRAGQQGKGISCRASGFELAGGTIQNYGSDSSSSNSSDSYDGGGSDILLQGWQIFSFQPAVSRPSQAAAG